MTPAVERQSPLIDVRPDSARNISFAGRHSQDSPEWYTPAPFVDAARHVMGGIDVDPASHEEANHTVNATDYFTAERNGLRQPWKGHVFLNPPGGLVAEFWEKLVAEYLSGHATMAVWVGYSLEQLQTLQKARTTPWPVGAARVSGTHRKTPMDFSMCVPSSRIAFAENHAKQEERIAKLRLQGRTAKRASSPSHANYITFMGPVGAKLEFARVFARFGQVTTR